jgi:hypothetical protein
MKTFRAKKLLDNHGELRQIGLLLGEQYREVDLTVHSTERPFASGHHIGAGLFISLA